MIAPGPQINPAIPTTGQFGPQPPPPTHTRAPWHWFGPLGVDVADPGAPWPVRCHPHVPYVVMATSLALGFAALMMIINGMTLGGTFFAGIMFMPLAIIGFSVGMNMIKVRQRYAHYRQQGLVGNTENPVVAGYNPGAVTNQPVPVAQVTIQQTFPHPSPTDPNPPGHNQDPPIPYNFPPPPPYDSLPGTVPEPTLKNKFPAKSPTTKHAPTPHNSRQPFNRPAPSAPSRGTAKR